MIVTHMLRNFLRCIGTLSLTAVLALPANLPAIEQTAHAVPPSNKANAETAHAVYGSLPTTFIANGGQLDSSVRYEVRSSAGHLFFTPQGVTLALTTADNAPVAPHDVEPAAQPIKPAVDAAPQTSIAVRVSFDSANPNLVLGGADQLPGIANFFIGSDPSQWHTNVPTYGGVAYRDLYPGIDLSYTGYVGVLKGTYTVAPGADPALIRWRYTGANSTHIDMTTGNLLIDAPVGVTLTEQVPEAWQIGANGVQRTVMAHYALTEDGAAQFTMGEYDHAQPLVIDPGLVYSTYLGGSGYDVGSAIAVDSSGSAYVTGSTTSANFPTTVGAFQTTYGGGDDTFVSKLNAAGSALVYSTYLSDSSPESGHEIAVDSSGSAYIMGDTYNTNFPITAGAFQTTYGGGRDAFVSKLNASGSSLIYSTYLGGSGNDEDGGIAVDSSGSAYVTGFTGSTDFPTTTGAYQTTNGGGGAFVSKLNAAGSALAYSTYLGGSSLSIGFGIAVDSSGNAYVTGFTSGNFPTTAGAYQTTAGGNRDVFVSKLNVTGSALVYSTYLGGNKDENGNGIAVDSSGSAYVTGNTYSTNFPTTTSAFQTTYNGGDAFVSKLNAAGSALVYSTYLGGSSYDGGDGIAVDSSGNVYVTGDTSSTDFPTTTSAFQTTTSGYTDAFVSKLNAAGSALAYSTYLGGGGNERGSGIAVDSSGSVYVTGDTSSTDFPTTTSAFQTAFGSGFQNTFVSKLNITPVPPTVTPTNSATPTLTPILTNTATLTTTVTSSSTPTATFTLSATTASSVTATNTTTPTNTPTPRKPDTIGVFRPSTATFYLRGSNTQGFADLTVQYGAMNSYPVVGDWTGGGVSTIGVFDPTNGQFQLRNSNTPGAADETFVLGIAGDQPFVGHWQAGAAHDGVGVFRPSNGLLYLKNELNSGFADYTMVLGIPGDVGVAGDWDGNGISSPGVFRPNIVTFYLSNQIVNGSVFGDHTVTLGYPGDVPLVGDWIAQEHAGVGVFRPTNGLIYLKNDLTTGFANVNIVYGIPNDIPVAGHWGISSAPTPRNSVIIPNTAFPPATTATPTRPPVRLTQPSSYDG